MNYAENQMEQLKNTEVGIYKEIPNEFPEEFTEVPSLLSDRLSTGKIFIPIDEHISSLALFAARYVHNRDTGGTGTAITAIKCLWGSLSEYVKFKIVKESYEATTNLDEWESFREWVRNESL